MSSTPQPDNDDNSVESIDFNNRDGENGILQLERELSEANKKFNVDADDDAGAGAGADQKLRSTSIRISELPVDLQDTAKQFDMNLDGDLSLGELAFAIEDLEKKRTSNQMLQRTVFGFLFLAIAMIVCIFAASITAARLSKDFTVNEGTGLALVKGSAEADEPEVMKTHSAVFYSDVVSIGQLSNADLGSLKEIILKDGDFKAAVKGYARDPFDAEEKVIVLVEGGTITYDDAGIVAATGTAKMALEALYGNDVFEADGRTRRLIGRTSGKAGFDNLSSQM